MPSSILTLPNEILAKIFGDEVLSDADIGRAIQVCKVFKENIQECADRKITLIIDAVTHPVWRFVRCLLETPEMGKQFVRMTVEWERRDFWKVSKKTTIWTTDWSWTEAEKEKISNICKEWEINEKTTSLILAGKNSEALLPLILCFTSKLKSLDLGVINPNIVVFGNTSRLSMRREAVELLGHEPDWDYAPYDEFDEHAEDGYNRVAALYESAHHSLFLFENLPYRYNGDIVGPKKLFPGLLNLENFTMHGYETVHTYTHHGPKLRDYIIFPILLLPRIKAVQFFNNIGESDNIRDPRDYQPHSDGPSTVKRLTLASSYLRWNYSDILTIRYHTYFETISKMTSNLEWADIKTKPSDWEEDTSADDEALGRLFLRNAEDTLKPSEIMINRGGFNETGAFIVDEERRREVARKQKAFELARARIEKLKPPPILSLNNTLISKLLTYLLRKDVFSLMLSCRAFYDICYRDMWSNFRLGPYDIGNEYRYFLSPQASRRLVKSIEKLGTDGFEHLERLEIAKYFYMDSDHNGSRLQILKLLTDPIELGNTPKLKFFYASWRGNFSYSSFGRPSPWDQPENLQFLHTLKKYSENLPPAQFSLNLLYDLDNDHINPSSLLDLSKLKNLKLVLGWDTSCEVMIQRVNSLVDILSASPNLETLTFKEESRREEMESEDETGQLWQALVVLQNVFGNLQHLRSLKTRGAFLIHPSFLLAPPRSCKTVSYSGRMTTTWWKKFAKEPFTGVERMTLKCKDLEPREQNLLEKATGEKWTPAEELILHDVQISGLKYLTINPPSGGLGSNITYKGYPSDFLSCMLKTNTQLSEDSLKPLADQVAQSYTQARESLISDIIDQYGRELKKTLSTALRSHAAESSLENIIQKRSVGESFQSEMRNKPIDMLLQQLEEGFGPKFVKQCTDDFRTTLRDGAPPRGREQDSRQQYLSYGYITDRRPGSDSEWEFEIGV